MWRRDKRAATLAIQNGNTAAGAAGVRIAVEHSQIEMGVVVEVTGDDGYRGPLPPDN